MATLAGGEEKDIQAFNELQRKLVENADTQKTVSHIRASYRLACCKRPLQMITLQLTTRVYICRRNSNYTLSNKQRDDQN